MMSMDRRSMIPNNNHGPPANKPKPSRLESLQQDFQRKLIREKEEKLLRQLDSNNQRQQQTINRYQDPHNVTTTTAVRKDPLSAPGGVRSYFQDRKKTQAPNSAGASVIQQQKKREGYDKSRPLQPLSNKSNTHSPQAQQQQQRQHSSKSEPNLKTSKLDKRPSEFERWRMEQDVLDKQRRVNAMNKRNAESVHSDYQSQVDNYQTEIAELHRMKHDEESERRALALQRQEEERERKAMLKQKQEDKRRRAADQGRRRREESERRQRELADDLEAEREAAEAEREEQAEMIRQLEEKLKQKQRDLDDIERRRPQDDPETEPPQSRHNQVTWRDPTPDSHRHNSHRQPTRKQPDKQVLPTKPRKVVRKPDAYKSKAQHYNSTQRDSPVSTQPKFADSSPAKAPTRPPTHELNTTYKISRENSPPIVVRRSAEELEPFVVDGAGLDIDLSACAVCGRNFATDRLAKHQKACKKVSKPRKQFNATAMRLAGSGAEKYQSKKYKAQEKKPAKKNWRSQHEEFIASIRYAKMVTAVEAGGGNIADLPPPPKSENVDYIQCPHCKRKYNQAAGERHIPKCKDIKAKPTMLKKGGRR